MRRNKQRSLGFVLAALAAVLLCSKSRQVLAGSIGGRFGIQMREAEARRQRQAQARQHHSGKAARHLLWGPSVFARPFSGHPGVYGTFGRRRYLLRPRYLIPRGPQHIHIERRIILQGN